MGRDQSNADGILAPVLLRGVTGSRPVSSGSAGVVRAWLGVAATWKLRPGMTREQKGGRHEQVNGSRGIGVKLVPCGPGMESGENERNQMETNETKRRSVRSQSVEGLPPIFKSYRITSQKRRLPDMVTAHSYQLTARRGPICTIAGDSVESARAAIAKARGGGL